MKIAFMIGSLRKGGAERAISNISLHIGEKAKQDIILIAENSVSYTHKASIKTHLVKQQVSFYKSTLSCFLRLKKNPFLIYLYPLFLKNIFCFIFSFIAYIYKLKKLKRKNNYYAVISFLEIANFLNILSQVKGQKLIVSIRTDIKYSLRKKLVYRLLIRFLYKRVDKITVLSEYTKKYLIQNYKISKDKIEIIPNFVDIKKINLLSREKVEDSLLNVFNMNRIIITVGRLEEVKGQWHIIKAFYLLKQATKNVKLVIVGHGKLEHKLKLLCKKLNIQNDVIFLGEVDNPFKYLANGDLFVSTSFYEGFPNVALEAMVCGLPIVYAECNGSVKDIIGLDCPKAIKEVKYCDYGILIPKIEQNRDIFSKVAKQERDLSRCLLKLLEDEGLRNRYSKLSLIRVKNFNTDKIMKKWYKILKF